MMKPFELPDFEVLALETADIVTSSNPFDQDYQYNDLIGWNGSLSS